MPFPRNYVDIISMVQKIKSLYEDSLDKPCLIVGNGPSCQEPYLNSAEIEQSVIFRMNWFFLEEEKTYSSRVDGFFCGVENKGLIKGLRQTVTENNYHISAFFQPFLESHDEEEKNCPAISYPELQPNFDHWSVIAGNPNLARFMMGRPLPTQGLQALAFAAELGFKKIYLSGIDLYADVSQRYAWDVPEEHREFLQEKDVTPGYEPHHGLDNDLKFLRTLRNHYDFELVGVSKMERIAPYLDGFTKKKPVVVKQNNEPKPGKVFATVIEGRYTLGAIALIRSLAKVSDAKMVVLYHEPAVPRRLAKFKNVILKRITPIKNPFNSSQSRFASTLNKLRIFELLEYERVAYVDADCLFLQNADELLETEGFCAAPDWGMDLNDDFNSGVLVFSPSENLRDRVFSRLFDGDSKSYDGGDQGFLNWLFENEWTTLPPEYNTLKRVLNYHPNLVSLSDVKILHMVGTDKPWDIHAEHNGYRHLNSLWLQFLEKEDWTGFYWMNNLFLYRRMRARNGQGACVETSFGHLYKKGQKAFEDKDYSEAVNALKSALVVNGVSTNAMSLLADAYLASGARKEAQETLQKAIAIRPDRTKLQKQLKKMNSLSARIKTIFHSSPRSKQKKAA